ncbi:uncharacterized protein PAC_12569 [Phialocephala subalpina]|uniref:FAD-binding FR-type domain-containing protein n=1 Tax=Phialocephala subalpina TaxID=576137 RepID=A0A1L7XCC8_9HELO|nr:uncharacterized protein PAC_12569 [Phialocephala subalpina]
MSISRQLVLPLRGAGHTWSNPRLVLRPPNVTCYTTSAIAQRNVKAWRSRRRSGGCIHGRRHTYSTNSSWTWDWTALMQALCEDESEAERAPTHSAKISIITVRTSKPESEVFLGPTTALELDARQWQRAWKEGIWTFQVSDYTKRFPRIFGNVSSYTPLPPLDGQDPGYIRLLVHRQEDDDVETDAVHEKVSQRGSLIRMARPKWFGYVAPIPKDVQQVILFASGVTGIAPMLQTIHTLLEARRGDGIEGRTPKIHVVWFKQNLGRVHGNGMAPSYETSFEASAVDRIASAELERLRLVRPDKLVIEPVDVGSTFAQVAKFIESAPRTRRKLTFLQRLGTWLQRPLSLGSFKTVDSARLLLISGSRGFAESLSGYSEGRSYTEDEPSILTKAEQAGWRILDLSTMQVCT